jgi:hypothetical protein
MVNSTLHQKESRPIQQYTSPLVRTTKRILIVNYENDVNFALKLVLEEQRSGGQDRTGVTVSRSILLTTIFQH